MASEVSYKNGSSKWRARVKSNSVEYFLGVFDTEEEATNEEEDFRKFNKDLENEIHSR